MPVRAVDGEADGHARRFGQHAALRALLPAIRRIAPAGFPPERRLRHRAVRRQPTPVDALDRLVFGEPAPPELVKHAGRPPLLKAPVRGGRGAEPRRRERVPLAAGAQAEEDGVHRAAVIHARVVAPERVRLAGRQQRGDLGPERIGRAPGAADANGRTGIGHGEFLASDPPPTRIRRTRLLGEALRGVARTFVDTAPQRRSTRRRRAAARRHVPWRGEPVRPMFARRRDAPPRCRIRRADLVLLCGYLHRGRCGSDVAPAACPAPVTPRTLARRPARCPDPWSSACTGIDADPQPLPRASSLLWGWSR